MKKNIYCPNRISTHFPKPYEIHIPSDKFWSFSFFTFNFRTSSIFLPDIAFASKSRGILTYQASPEGNISSIAIASWYLSITLLCLASPTKKTRLLSSCWILMIASSTFFRHLINRSLEKKFLLLKSPSLTIRVSVAKVVWHRRSYNTAIHKDHGKPLPNRV